MSADAVSCELERYVASLVAAGAIRSDRVRRAFVRVRRHRFLDHWYRMEGGRGSVGWTRVEFDAERPTPQELRHIYSNRLVVTRVEGTFPVSSMSEPRLAAAMLEALDVAPGMRVLEIGTGTGYNAALLAEVLEDSGAVYTVEVREDVAREAIDHLRVEGYGRAHVICTDGFHGAPDGAPYARIVATVGCPDIAPAWIEQLAHDGFSLVPLQHGCDHPLVRWERSHDPRGVAVGRVVGFSGFMPMRGTLASPNPWQSYLIGGLPENPTRVWPVPEALGASRDEPGCVFDVPAQRDFSFFLGLASRELWRTAEGYGLADPGLRAAIVVTSRGVEGRSREDRIAPIDRLWHRLNVLLQCWEELGRPAAGDYELVFIPRQRVATLEASSDREWVIERARHWELVRLGV